ncbi:Hsp20/alpha crystallin family protein [Bacillus altitudinis]|uniref:Hsp20/alpha crystallin family protein n=1 Tax=Bacillus altitudinis TaxID=293387 RepID=UPI00148ECBEB|nr:Hsp20/alpha crystallin family protein [Bacillus altitudinis]MDH3109844.1 Hsp20/alpha crystallin family protein [Bacillus altitudinis]NOL32777.1 Hsp20/alpha crystallin family protein [Bacillus altitudinis]
MENEKQVNSSDFLEIDDWLNVLMDDPFAWYDEQLPIDLYETSRDYIIEIDLSTLSITDLKLTFSGCELILAYLIDGREQPIEKSVMLPFYLNDKDIDTDYENRIISIKIKKDAHRQDGAFSFQMPHFKH